MNNKQTLLEWVDAQIKRIDDDERYHYEPALVHINAPLALIQVEMEAQMQVLKAVRKRLVEG